MIDFSAMIAEVFVPVLCIIFCLNLVSIIQKTVNKEETMWNTFFLTVSFTLIIWSISVFAPIY